MSDIGSTRPHLPPKYVSRPRLVTSLDQAGATALTLLCAGPGAGKTALLADWAGRLDTPVAWLSLAQADRQPARFWRLIDSALEGDDRRGPDQATGLDWADALLRQFDDPASPLVVIVDNAQVIEHPDVLDGLDRLIRAGQRGLRLVLAARRDPPLPLHKYRLDGQLFELRAAELAMTAGEARNVLSDHGVTLADPDVDLLMARTEGWAAGVRLLAMRMEGSHEPGSLAAQVEMGPGSVGEYLTDEILRCQPERHRRLLVETSFLDEVTGPLADAITGVPGSGDILADLASSHLFVMPADPLHTRFRYHQLFREVLRYLLQRRPERAVRDLKQRAAAWFEANGDPGQAMYWAAQADDRPRVAALLARSGFAHAFVRRLDLSTLGLGELAATQDHVESALAGYAMEAVSSGPDAAELGLARLRDWAAEGSLTDRDLLVARDLVELVFGQRACDRDAVDLAASRLLGTGDDVTDIRPPSVEGLRAAVLLAQASAHLWHGTHEDVEALLASALAEAQRAGHELLELEALALMAVADTFWARINRADETAQRARALAERTGHKAPAALDLATALRALACGDLGGGPVMAEGMTVPEQDADPGLAAALALGRAGLLLAHGDEAGALAILHEQGARRLPPLLSVHRDVMLAGLETARGRPRSAMGLLDKYTGTEFAVLAACARARALLAQGDPRAARDCVRTVLSTPSTQTGRLTTIEAMLCDAQITLHEDAPGHALEILIRAIELARDEIKLPFLLTGDAFTSLLGRHPDVAVRWPVPLAETGLQAPAAATPAAPRDLPDPLTPRELTILRYLTSAMSSAEIAGELCLSINTVKTHLAAIYRKLPASSRREAVLRARELELI
ncbi:MAG TPA: LuxR C-terminal-related transcriptional regulator [Trebonia sp.]|nr:LuxR C-terminal-related transcriptional regulator [Trebonia sp.]